MKWPSVVAVLCASLAAAQWTHDRKIQMREATRDLWKHGFTSYMRYAFPMDELRPLSCTGLGPNWEDPTDIAVNDVAGNYTLTLIDVLDTLVTLNDPWSHAQFSLAVRHVIEYVSFDVNTKPQVFEITIRALGGLLSGHIFASNPKHPYYLEWYNDELLSLAKDLGERLLPAFNTPTGLPYARINLRHGVSKLESTQTCTAGAGSLILEFGTLSRLTNDPRFEKAAYKAYFALWNRRSDLGLVGNTIDIRTGKWMAPEVTGVGAGLDSFFEYALKWYVLSGEMEFLDVWNQSYDSLMSHSRGSEGFWYRTVTISKGQAATSSIDSLSAFWAGLQVLGGDVENAIKSHLIYWNLWRKYRGIPEIFDTVTQVPNANGYPLRPEFAESTYFLYRATGDTFYLDVGEQILADLIQRAKVPCGIATVRDLVKDTLDDRMESFVLSETLKYLFLLFDESNPLNADDSHFVFTTEGHVLTLPLHLMKPLSPSRREARKDQRLICPAFQPYALHADGLAQGIRSRPDAEYARHLVGPLIEQVLADAPFWSPEGTCEVPKVDLYVRNSLSFSSQSTASEIVISHAMSLLIMQMLNGSGAELGPDGLIEDPTPGRNKVQVWKDGYIIKDVRGVRAHATGRMDGRGYDITKLGTHPIHRGQKIYISDSTIFGKAYSAGEQARDLSVTLKFKITPSNETLGYDPEFVLYTSGAVMKLDLIAWTASFGGNPAGEMKKGAIGPAFSIHGWPLRLVHPAGNYYGCSPYTPADNIPLDSVVLVARGECTFLDKLSFAHEAGAAGVVVWNPEGGDGPNPGLAEEEKAFAQEHLSGKVLLVIGDAGVSHLKRMLTWNEEVMDGRTELWVEVEKIEREELPVEKPGRMLYVNGYAMLNSVLLF